MQLGFKYCGNAHGKPLAIVHGWGADSSYLQNIAEHYHERHVMLIDLPGYGMSSHLCAYCSNFEAICDLLYNTLDEHVDLMAWSLSSLFAIHLANREPKKIDSLVTICGTPRFPSDPNWPGMSGATVIKCKRFLNSRRALRIIGTFFKGQALAKGDCDEQLALSLAELEHKLSLLDCNTLLAGIDLMSYCDVRADLKNIKIPSLHLFGAKDLLVPCEQAQLCQHEHQSSSYIFPYSGHMPFLSEAKSFYKVVDDFYKQLKDY